MGSPVIFNGSFAKVLPQGGLRSDGDLNLQAAGSVAVLNASNASIAFEFQSNGAASTSTILEAAQSANVTVTLPDATTTLVGTDTVDQLTNKRFNDAIVMAELGATPGTPAASTIALYADNSTNLLFLDSGGNSHAIIDYVSGSGADMVLLTS